jgi:hypothetical protein
MLFMTSPSNMSALYARDGCTVHLGRHCPQVHAPCGPPVIYHPSDIGAMDGRYWPYQRYPFRFY